MTCIRCGNCCFYLNVTVSPKYIDEDIDLNNIEDEKIITIDGISEFCPHLYWDDENNNAICKIHDKKWYNQTPCYRHMNPEFENLGDCRIGPYIKSNQILLNELKNKIKKHEQR